MLSLGACVVGQTSQTFYTEIKPINKNFVQTAMEVNKLSFTDLQNRGEEPASAMARFEQWILKVTDGKRAVFVAHNATFDWSFTHWYFIKFLGRTPFGISGLDIKAYYMGKMHTKWGETTKKKMKMEFRSQKEHTHNALDDAIEQAEIFEKLLKG